jgi:23S rRNA (guanosine2251-2'-O)-methyltransferase
MLASEDGDLGLLAAGARDHGITVRLADARELDALAAGVLHQGAVAVAPPFAYAALEDLSTARVLVALDGITDPQNLGAIARSAEALGAGGLILPRRRSAHVTPAAEKAAAGAFSWLPVAVVPNLARALHIVGEAGLWSVGLDSDAPTAIWDCRLLDGPVVLVVGAEGRGLSRLVAERVDARASIPLGGQVGSLNAAAAAAVGLCEVARRGNVR